MFTIRIKTRSTTKFSWNSCGARSIGECTTTGLHAAVVEAIEDFRAYARGDGAQDGSHACFVTWEDGDDFHAFIFNMKDEIPRDLPWTLMRSKPERVLREH